MSQMTAKSRTAPGGGRHVLALAVALSLAACAATRADEVTLIAGSTFKQGIGGRVLGTVESESPTEVTVQLGANTIRVPTDQILSIRYDGQPASFQLAETREASGQYAESAELFRKAATEAQGRPFLVRAAQFREAEVLADLALAEPERMKEAKDRLTRFVQANPGCRQIVAAREALARLQLQSGDFAAASATINEIAKLPNFAERASVLRTKVLARQAKHDEAIAELDRLIASFPKGSVRQRAALLAKAENLAALKRFKEGETLVREVIKASPPEDAAAQAPAYNTLGDCLRASNRPKDALIAYLHTDLLYSKDKEEHPRALYQIEALFRQLNQAARADEIAQRLKQEYPRSPWTAKVTAASGN
jgi:tetratricopeptide (TPR) repeat protein